MLFPEHDKVREIKHLSQSIHEFIIWLSDTKDIHLAEWHHGRVRDELRYPSDSREELVAEFFEVDLKAFNKEKEQMYEQLSRPRVP